MNRVLMVGALVAGLMFYTFAHAQAGGGVNAASGASTAPAGEVLPPLSIVRGGTQASIKAPAEHFTGVVRVDPLFTAVAPARTSGAYVTFEPGARSDWHTHPYGQVLVVTQGVGRVQRWGGAVEEMHAGDVVRIAPGQKHWHGAAPTTAMTHLAVQEHLDGRTVDWLEKVSDAQYTGQPQAARE